MMKGLSIIYGSAAAFIPSSRTMVIADLHIGIENEFHERGIHIRSKTDELLDRIAELLGKTGAEKLFILGDVKHVISSSPFSQRRELTRFFEKLRDSVDISIVPGNHDGGLKAILPYADIKDSGGYVLEESIGLIHGHRWPSEKIIRCPTIITAHTHPVVSLKDNFGYEFFERCWAISKSDAEKVKRRYGFSAAAEIVIMPAFNPICGGVAVNREGIIGPVSKIINMEESEVYLLDGSSLGKIKGLR